MDSFKGQVAAKQPIAGNCSIAAPTKMPIGVEEKGYPRREEKPQPYAGA